MENLHEKLRIAALQWTKCMTYGTNHYGCPRGGRCTIICSEVVSRANDIPDVIGWNEGISVLIECKASKEDFKRDQDKPQRQNGRGMGQKRYYFAPVGLISKNELPPEWGLIEWKGKTGECIVNCPPRILTVEDHIEEKRLLLSLVRRIKKREFLIIQQEEFPTRLD